MKRRTDRIPYNSIGLNAIPDTTKENTNLPINLVYNVLGEEVKTLVEKLEPRGNYEVNFDASGLPSGFIYRMQAGSFTDIKKLILMK